MIWFNRYFTTFIQFFLSKTFFFFYLWAQNGQRWVTDTPLLTMPSEQWHRFSGVSCVPSCCSGMAFLSHELAAVGELAVYAWPQGMQSDFIYISRAWMGFLMVHPQKQRLKKNCNLWAHLQSGSNLMMATIQIKRESDCNAFHRSQSVMTGD